MPDRIARVWTGSAWEVITSTAAAPNAVVTYQSTAPSSPVTGQVWVDSDDNITYIWDGSAWVSTKIDASSVFSGTLPVARGGTGVTTSTGTGNVVLSASPTFSGTVTAPTITSSTAITSTGLTTLGEITEILTTGTISTNVFTANASSGNIFYVTTAPAANFTINITNLPTTDNRVFSFSFFVIQGATGYIPNALQIAGAAQTIKWSGGTAPTATSGAGKVDVFNFTVIRRSAAWEVLGDVSKNY